MSIQPNQLKTARLRRSLGAQLADEARRRGVPADQIRKQYIFTIFLRRIFPTPDGNWVLLGGNALLIRTGGGRFTNDIDLARRTTWDSVGAARDELQALADTGAELDPFQFHLGSERVHREADPFGYGTTTGRLRAVASLGGSVFETFTIDITIRRHIDGPVDLVLLKPIIDHETLENLPAVPTTPVENHLADKVCALYEKHGGHSELPSTRYRDLADIVRIIRSISFDAGRLANILRREAGRRKLTLPAQLESPRAAWVQAFPRAARDFAEFPIEFHQLDASLTYAGRSLNEILDGTRSTGSWDPAGHVWRTDQ